MIRPLACKALAELYKKFLNVSKLYVRSSTFLDCFDPLKCQLFVEVFAPRMLAKATTFGGCIARLWRVASVTATPLPLLLLVWLLLYLSSQAGVNSEP